ncbi:hypothetical protein MRY82_07000 [bacterium]|nr:hypothetical protein [bacterium]
MELIKEKNSTNIPYRKNIFSNITKLDESKKCSKLCKCKDFYLGAAIDKEAYDSMLEFWGLS